MNETARKTTLIWKINLLTKKTYSVKASVKRVWKKGNEKSECLNSTGPCLFIWIAIGPIFGWSCVRPIGSACALRIVIVSMNCLPNLEVKVRFKWVKVRSMRNMCVECTASGLIFQAKNLLGGIAKAISNLCPRDQDDVSRVWAASRLLVAEAIISLFQLIHFFQSLTIQPHLVFEKIE